MNLDRRLARLERCDMFHAPQSFVSFIREAQDLARGTGMTFDDAFQELIVKVPDEEFKGLVEDAKAYALANGMERLLSEYSLQTSGGTNDPAG